MRSTRPVLTILSLLLTLFLTNISLRAADDDGEDYDLKERVVRISLINGEVTLKRLGKILTAALLTSRSAGVALATKSIPRRSTMF